jgi:hypothetical protein
MAAAGILKQEAAGILKQEAAGKRYTWQLQTILTTNSCKQTLEMTSADKWINKR